MPAMPTHTLSAPAHDAALQMLYAMELDGQELAQVQSWYQQAHPLDEATLQAAVALLGAVIEHRARIAGLIESHSHHWRLRRMDVIDRCLLQLSIGEMLRAPGAATADAVVNEALRMARRFSQPEAVGFIHGILDAVAAEVGQRDEAR